MSYDLYLKPRFGSIDQASLLDYFRRRPKYAVEGEQAVYENEDTGVQFCFEINRGESDEREADYPMLFNLAYFRPSYWVLEAEPEVAAFVRNLDCVALDPQTNGMGEGDYRGDRLVAGWNTGNEFAYQAILLRHDEVRRDIVTFPTDKLRGVWQWNYERATLQERIVGDKFVPRILFLLVDGRLSTTIIWGDGMPMVFPAVDFILVARDRLAPRRWFRHTPDTIPLLWPDALTLLEPYLIRHADGAFALNYDEPPVALRGALRRLPSLGRNLELVDMNSVLDADIVDKVLKPR